MISNVFYQYKIRFSGWVFIWTTDFCIRQQLFCLVGKKKITLILIQNTYFLSIYLEYILSKDWFTRDINYTSCLFLNKICIFFCCHIFFIFMVVNVILSADLAVIFFKYQTSSSSINRSSNGLLILLLKVSAMWTYLSVVLILLCPISSFTILMSVPCSSR